ncbi:uncharacterized protein LOC143788930 [Ranitomeya variabilis]|uniref:uncharacterized protein LOC143788930 n=1 Tax=Ranitomeya variabilis TaxID=490064 RepID=UPI004057B76D
MGRPISPPNKIKISMHTRGKLSLRRLFASRRLFCWFWKRNRGSPKNRTAFFRTNRMPTRRARKKRRGSSHDVEVTDDLTLCTYNIRNLYIYDTLFSHSLPGILSTTQGLSHLTSQSFYLDKTATRSYTITLSRAGTTQGLSHLTSQSYYLDKAAIL